MNYDESEDWSSPFAATPLNLPYSFSSPSYWTLNISENDENSNWNFFKSLSFNPAIPSSIKWRRNIVYQILWGHCKRETLIFKSVAFGWPKSNCVFFVRRWQTNFSWETETSLHDISSIFSDYFCPSLKVSSFFVKDDLLSSSAMKFNKLEYRLS